jgi:hypothetical protein
MTLRTSHIALGLALGLVAGSAFSPAGAQAQIKIGIGDAWAEPLSVMPQT